MSYQKCPKCEGTGKKFNPIFTGNPWLDAAILITPPSALFKRKEDDNICPVCKGKMIISELTGLPPK